MKIPISYSVDEELPPLIKQVADEKDRTQSWVVNQVIKQYLIKKGMIKVNAQKQKRLLKRN